jgi:hypothetical protein
MKNILTDRNIKIGLISIFAAGGVHHFNEEIAKLLLDNAFNQISVDEANGKLKIVCDIIKKHELEFHSEPIKQLILNQSLSKEDKINLLKIKLDSIINCEFAGKKRFLVASILAIIITLSFSGISGLSIFLEALYRLFQEGKLSKAVYEELKEIIEKKAGKVPIEEFF